MTNRWTVAVVGGFVAASFFSILLLSCLDSWRPHASSNGNPQTYQVNGRVRLLTPDAQTILIEHGNIPGLVPAMVTTFSIHDPALVRGLRNGDRVNVQFTVDRDRWQARRLEKIPTVHSRGAVLGLVRLG